jgi:hypothetical protein
MDEIDNDVFLVCECTALVLEKLAEIYSSSGMSFQDSFEKLLPRPWVIDDLDQFKQKWLRKPWKKVGIVLCHT